jgi:hypothetical protein
MKHTQQALVLNHMKKRPITSWEAIELYGCTRLAAVINVLREHYIVDSVWEYGNDGTKWKKYFYRGLK